MKKKKIVASIEARMTSSRLPGKVLMEVDGVPLLKLMLSRVKKSKLLDQIVIATSTQSNDNVIGIWVIKYTKNMARRSEFIFATIHVDEQITR